MLSEVWQVQEAKARFSEFLDASLSKGPQIVTRRGVEEAVLVPMNEWRKLKEQAKPNIKDLLLSPVGRGDLNIPPRGRVRVRRVVDLSD